MKGYLDTCLISAVIKLDLNEIDQLALNKINDKYIANEVELFVSEHVEEELIKIPLQFRQKRLDVFDMFASAPKATVGGVTKIGLHGGVAANPKRRQMKALLSLLPDKDDAWHLFIASRGRPEIIRYPHTLLSESFCIQGSFSLAILSNLYSKR